MSSFLDYQLIWNDETKMLNEKTDIYTNVKFSIKIAIFRILDDFNPDTADFHSGS
jgi:hypothetical protein